MDRLTLITASAHGSGGAATLPLLCRMLAEQGLLSGVQIETLRHAALGGFDHARRHRELSEKESGFFETGRQHADSLWQSAALAAEGRG